MTGESEILFKSRNFPENFKITICHQPFSPSVNTDTLHDIWKNIQDSHQARGRTLWNGTYYRLVNLERLRLTQNTLELGTIQYSTVRSLIEMNKTIPLDPANYPFQVNTGALIRTSDGFFIFGRKDTGTQLGSESIEIIGGGLQSNELLVKEGKDLAANILKEMHEEINVSPEQIDRLESLGFIRSGNTMGIIMVFEILLKLTLLEVQEAFKVRTELEFSELVAVPEWNLTAFLQLQKDYTRFLGELLN